jgi:hypothetical protein
VSDLIAQHHAADFSARLILENCRAAHRALAVHLLVEAAERLFQANVTHDAAAIQHAERFPLGRLPLRLARRVRAPKRVVVEEQWIAAALADTVTCLPSNKLKCGENAARWAINGPKGSLLRTRSERSTPLMRMRLKSVPLMSLLWRRYS